MFGRPEAVEAGAGVEGHLAEQRPAADVVEIDPDEIEAPAERLGRFDHHRERARPLQIARIGRKVEADRETPPVEVEEGPLVTVLPVGVDLHDPGSPAEDEDLVIDWKRAGIADERLDQELRLDLRVEPLVEDPAIASAKPALGTPPDPRPILSPRPHEGALAGGVVGQMLASRGL